jgi:hypothetical protein
MSTFAEDSGPTQVTSNRTNATIGATEAALHFTENVHTRATASEFASSSLFPRNDTSTGSSVERY